MVVALWAWTVFGVEKGVAGTAWSPTVFLVTLHSCADEYAAHMYVKVAACNSQPIARSGCGVMRVPVSLCCAVVVLWCFAFALMRCVVGVAAWRTVIVLLL